MTKALILSFALLTSVAFASDPAQEEFKGNWTKLYTLVDGSQVLHTPTATKMGGISAGQGLNMQMKFYNGYPVNPGGLVLETNSTEQEFEEALLKSGLYKKK